MFQAKLNKNKQKEANKYANDRPLHENVRLEICETGNADKNNLIINPRT